MSTNHLTDLTIAAEVRGFVEGHQARIVDGRAVVKSDSVEGLNWIVTAYTGREGDGIIFDCRADDPALADGRGHFPLSSREPGCICCKHASRLARRMEREGLARFDGGRWVATAKAVELVAAVHETDDADAEAIFARL